MYTALAVSSVSSPLVAVVGSTFATRPEHGSAPAKRRRVARRFRALRPFGLRALRLSPA